MTAYASSSAESADFLALMRGFAAGGVAAAVSKTMTAPAERVKLILQLQSRANVPSTSSSSAYTLERNYRGIFDCFKSLYVEQGLRSLWRGNLATIARCFPTHALNFALRDHYRLLFLKNVDRKKQYGRFVLGNTAAGALGSMTCLCLVYPLDLARTRLAVDTKRDGSSKYRGIYDCLRQITRREGPVGAYRGFFMSLQHVTVYGAVFFGMFDTIRGTISEDERQLNFFSVWMLAQACVVSSSLICYPMDTVRRKLAMQSGQQVKPFSGSLDCFAKTFRSEGLPAFYRGALCHSLKSMSGALILAVYYEAMKYS